MEALFPSPADVAPGTAPEREELIAWVAGFDAALTGWYSEGCRPRATEALSIGQPSRAGDTRGGSKALLDDCAARKPSFLHRRPQGLHTWATRQDVMGTIAARAQEAAKVGTGAARLRSLASDRSPQVRRQVAANLNTPPDVAASLAFDRDWRTRAAVATRAAVPADVLVALVEDRVWLVRFALAENKHASPAVWEAITRASDTGIRMVLAQQTWLPRDVAMRLAEDTAKDVRQGLAAGTTHPEVFTVLTNDAHQDVRAAALSNPEAPQV